MNFIKTLLAAAAVTASVGAGATVVPTLGTGIGPFFTPTTTTPGVACTAATCAVPTIGTISGGQVLISASGTADPVLNGLSFLSAGPAATSPATLLFTSPVSFVSFLWGSPDAIGANVNTITVISSSGTTSQSFTPASLGFSEIAGNQDPLFNQYVSFSASAGLITSLIFSSTGNAFEATNFSISPIPEPETYALMLAGLAALGFVSKRRKQA